MNHIEVDQLKQKVYTVQFAFFNIDSHDDKHNAFDEPDVWQIDLPATTAIEAIDNAHRILTIARSEIMVDIFSGVLENDEPISLNKIQEMINHAVEKNVFKSWLLIQPTSVQCTLKDDLEKLKDMSYVNMTKTISNVGNQVEDYLKEINNDNA